jgi:hypothetical protein
MNNLKIRSILASYAICCFTGLGQTNRFFITDELSNHQSNGSVTCSSAQMEAAKHAPECRPAEDDPEGHWGTNTEGFQVSLRLSKGTFSNGEPILATIILRNVSNRELAYMEPRGPWDFDRYTSAVLLTGKERVQSNEEPKPGMTFSERVRLAHPGSYILTSSPVGTQRKFSVDLTKLFPITNGQYTVIGVRTVPIPGEINSTNAFSAPGKFEVVPALR